MLSVKAGVTKWSISLTANYQTQNELLTKMRGYTVGDMRSAEMRAELDRRQTIAQMPS